MTLDTGEFTRRFSQHILPRGFAKVRHYGLLANRGRSQRLDKARAALGEVLISLPNPAPSLNESVQHKEPEEPQLRHCPYCGGSMLWIIQIVRPPGWDTS